MRIEYIDLIHEVAAFDSETLKDLKREKKKNDLENFPGTQETDKRIGQKISCPNILYNSEKENNFANFSAQNILVIDYLRYYISDLLCNGLISVKLFKYYLVCLIFSSKKCMKKSKLFEFIYMSKSQISNFKKSCEIVSENLTNFNTKIVIYKALESICKYENLNHISDFEFEIIKFDYLVFDVILNIDYPNSLNSPNFTKSNFLDLKQIKLQKLQKLK